ncbi:MAG: DUF58 domain-containing protein [Nanoarchaeota archaeon]|nr:DUF58 domain-containing protein [Nanoarchaeota archaeon]
MKDILRQIKKLEISTRDPVSGIMAGNYHSIFKGQGIEFSDLREYMTGDDVRMIDWNVTARMNKPFLKEFIEERDLSVYFLMDVSGSFNFGDLITKNRKAIELIASLMFSAVKNNDSVGGFFASDEVEKFIPAKKGKKHSFRVLKDMLSFEPKSKVTDLNEVIMSVSNILKRRSLIFIVSDFVSESFDNALRVLRNRHDVVAIKLSDLKEKQMPDIGFIELEDEETGEQMLVDTSDKEFQENYNRVILEHDDNLKKVFARSSVDMIEVFTDKDFSKELNNFFKIRKMRSVR